jgi:signal transduction histidine kinase
MAENLAGGKIPEAPRQQEYFRFIVQECRRLSSLIENVLDFSRIEQGRKQYEFEPTDLIALTQITMKLMEPCATEKGVNLRFEPAAGNLESLVMEADGRALQQALVNLIDNAVKHSPKGETVMVEVQAQKKDGLAGADSALSVISLSVVDHGPGIPLAEQEKIFERFYRLGSELRRETPGMGIGLSVVKHIVDAHRGRIVVQSQPGQGSRFTIELPLTRQS